MLFNYTREALYHPERFRPFRVNGELPICDLTTVDVTAAEAWHLCNFAHSAYLDSESLADVLKSVGVELLKTVDRGGTQGFVARGADYVVVSFRGTQPDEHADIKADVNLPLVDFPAGGRVHRGFEAALKIVWADIEGVLKGLSDLPVWFTGHSLGAALATVAVAQRTGMKSDRLVTFGSPRVGNQAFVDLLANVPTFRYVDGADLVTMLPPEVLYRHTGTMVFVSETEPAVVNPSAPFVRKYRFKSIVRYWLRFPIFRRGEVKMRSLVDHAVVNYTAAIGKDL